MMKIVLTYISTSSLGNKLVEFVAAIGNFPSNLFRNSNINLFKYFLDPTLAYIAYLLGSRLENVYFFALKGDITEKGDRKTYPDIIISFSC